jgi:RimJ/RimL family protein N-acetyltransferase
MVRLREACAADAERLYAWRIDAETVKQSIAPPPACLEDHRRWLDEVLRDSRVTLFVAYDEQRAVDVGAVRIDRRSGGDAELSITVAPEQRGRGYARGLISCGIAAAGSLRIVARVKPENLRSLRAFRALGFVGDTANGAGLIRLVHEPAALDRSAGA